MKGFPELITNRLKLRKIQLDDVSSLLKYANNKNISDQILNMPFPYQEEDAIYRLNFVLQGFKNKERYVFAITLKDSKELIGEIELFLHPPDYPQRKNEDEAQNGDGGDVEPEKKN